VTQTSEHFGRLDIVINNAGTSSAQPFEQVETEFWQHDLDLKLFGAIHCSRIGNTDEAAKVITFLVSDAASYVTGTAINIDGGKSGVL
jgi:NAD(P)-dependent dehydrogenase (short-subunit alcohol dehydrogenase family)